MTGFSLANIDLTQAEWLWLIPGLLIATLLCRTLGEPSNSVDARTGYSSPRDHLIHPLISLLPKIDSIHKLPKLLLLGYGLVFLSLVLCLTEPVRVGEKLPDPPQERDIVFIVDTSLSMSLRDYVLNGSRIDRITMLKGVLDHLILKLSGDRISIIVFGESAYTLLPLSRDQGLLRQMVARIQIGMAGRYNNLGEAISLAVKQTLQESKANKKRILVLMTDADKSTGEIHPTTAAELASDAKLPLYSIAIGAANVEAEEVELPSAGLIYEPVDLDLLASISELTGARSYQAGDIQALERAVNDISQHETHKQKRLPRHHREPLYLWPLLFALTLVFLLSLLSTIKLYGRKALSRVVVKTKKDAASK